MPDTIDTQQKMTVFVTGATGLLGSNTVRLLHSKGHHVKAMARNAEKAKRFLGDLDVEIITGDMEDIAAFEVHLSGCDVIMHTAAYFREYYEVGEDHWTKLKRININATLQLLTAAEKHGVKKAIHVSSSGAIGKNPTGGISDETTQIDDFHMENLYFRSKIQGEQEIAKWLKAHHMPVTLINPTGIMGPGDAAPTAAGQMIVDFLNGDFPPILPPGGGSMVDARDVALAMFHAIDKGRNGERYIINQRYHDFSELIQMLSGITGVTAPRFNAPMWALMIFATVGEFSAQFTGSQPLITRNVLKAVSHRVDYSNDKAIRELGHNPRPFKETIRDEVQWFVDNGYIKKSLQLKPITATS